MFLDKFRRKDKTTNLSDYVQCFTRFPKSL